MGSKRFRTDWYIGVENRLASMEESIKEMKSYIATGFSDLERKISEIRVLILDEKSVSNNDSNSPMKKSYSKDDFKFEDASGGVSSSNANIFKKPVGDYRVEENNVLNYIFNSNGAQNEIIVKMDLMTGDRHELELLNGSKWLSGDIINLYTCMLRWDNRNIISQKASEKWYMPTYASQYILSNMCDAGTLFRHYLLEHKCGGDIQKCDQIFIPMNVNKNHWCLCVVDIAKQEVVIMNSLKQGNCPKLLSDVKTMVTCFEEALEFGSESYFLNISLFPVRMADWAPQQKNFYDCGVFVIRFMQQYSELRDKEGKNFRIEKSSVERMKMALEIFYHPSNIMKEKVLEKLVGFKHSQKPIVTMNWHHRQLGFVKLFHLCLLLWVRLRGSCNHERARKFKPSRKKHPLNHITG